MTCEGCGGQIPLVGWNDKEFFEACPWCGRPVEMDDEAAEAERYTRTNGEKRCERP